MAIGDKKKVLMEKDIGEAINPAAIGAATTPNLADNSDFSNPVNLNGLAEYKGAVEGISKWACTSNNWMITVEDGWIKVSDNPDSSSTSTAMVRQTITVTPGLRGKTVTLAAKLKGDGMVRLNINNKDIGEYAGKDDWHIKVVTGTVPADAETIFVALQCRNMETWYCEWVALYEGAYTVETLPEYQPKGYSVERLNCVGALALDGSDTMTGPLNISGSSYPSVFLKNTTTGRQAIVDAGGSVGRSNFYNWLDANNQQCLTVCAETESLESALKLRRVIEGTPAEYNILHTGNKPTGIYGGTGGAWAEGYPVGGIGNALLIYSDIPNGSNFMGIATPFGLLYVDSNHNISFTRGVWFAYGNLYNSGTTVANEQGLDYNYELL